MTAKSVGDNGTSPKTFGNKNKQNTKTVQTNDIT